MSQIHTFSQMQGLIDNKYNSFVSQDARGSIWIGSPKGITVLRDNRAQQYVLNTEPGFKGSGVIQSNFYKDNDEGIWFTTYDALVKLDGKTGQFLRYKLQHNGVDIPDEYHLFHIDDKQNEMWLSANRKLLKVQVLDPFDHEVMADDILGRRFLFIEKTDKYPRTILGMPWIENTGFEEFKFEGSELKYNYYPTLSRGLTNINVKMSGGVVINQTLWSPSQKGLIEYNLEKKKVINVHKKDLWEDFFDVVLYKESTLILSAKSMGLIFFNLDTKSFFTPSFFDITQNDFNARQLFLFNDRELWMNNFEKGLVLFDLDQFEPEIRQKYTLPDGQSFSSIHSSKDHIIVGRSNGILDIIDYDLKIIRSLESPDGLNIQALKQQDDQTLWYRTMDNLYQLTSSGKDFLASLSIPNQQIFDFNIGPNSVRILGASDVFVTQGEDRRIDVDSILSKPFRTLLTVHSSKDITVYSYDARYLWMQDHKGDRDTTYDIGSEVNDIIFSKNSEQIFIAAKNGLYNVDSKNLDFQKLLNKPYQVGGNEVYHLAEIDDTLWVFDTRSIGKWDQTEGTFFRTPYPYLEPGPSGFRITTSDDGNFWFCGSNTLIKIDPSKILFDTSQIYSHVHEIIINDQRLVSDTSYNFINRLELNHQQNTVSLDVSAIDNYQSTGSFVQYRLLGYDSTWQFNGDDGLIQFINLPPDDYRLQLIPIRASGMKGHIRTLDILIDPPYWQTWWFRTSVALILIGVGWLVSFLINRRKILEQKIQLDRQKALSDQRERLANDLHDELGTELSKILYLSDEASHISDTNKKEELLLDISKMATSSIRNMRDLLWVMDEKNGTLDDLLKRLKNSVVQSLTSYPIMPNFNLPQITPDIMLTADQRHHLMLLTKEIVHNVVKHADASTVEFNAEIDNNSLILSISDNGSGFDPNEHGSNGKGMRSLQKRAFAIEGQLEIISNSADGTTITLECPLVLTEE